MKRVMMGLCLMVALLLSGNVFAGHGGETSKQAIGVLTCKVLPHSGLNLLIHSSRDIRCVFTSKDQRMIEHYKGETGIKFGIDISFDKHEDITYSVLSKDSKVGAYQLAGKYSGASSNATLGVSAGQAAPIEKNDKRISLQPINIKNNGIGAAAGFSYLYLEVDKK